MTQQRGGDWRAPESDAAESTQYRPTARDMGDLAGRDDSPLDRSFFANAGSIRMHSRSTSWGLAAKIAAPIMAAMLVAMIVLAYIIQGKVEELQLSDTKAKAYPIVRTTGKFGRILLAWRDRFFAENPDYDSATEWKVDEHWLVTGGFISANKWAALVGRAPDSVVPMNLLTRAEQKAALLNLSEWVMDGAEVDEDQEMIAAYIIDDNGSPVAASIDLLPGAILTSSVIWTFPEGGSPAAGAGADEAVRADYLPDRGQEPVLRVAVAITRNAVNREKIGTAVALFRTDRMNYERRGFMVVFVVFSVCLVAVMGLVCWLSARRVTIPLRRLAVDMHAIADGDLTRRSAISGSDDIGMVAMAFNSMAERLRVAKLNAAEANRLDSDLSVARSIQNSLLPPQTPRIRGLDIYTAYKPAKEIGGDYYDFLPVDSQHMGLVVADASGKSIPAALVMSTTRAILRFVAPGSTSAAATLTRINAILSVDIPRGMFVTAYYLIYDPLKSAMTCASAGHNPLLLGRADGTVEMVNPGGIALGFDQGPIFQRSIREQTVQLAQGDRVLMYTDGVVECANVENEEYSDRRLQEFLRRHRDLPSNDFVGELLADLDRHRGGADIRDDTTIVTFKVL